MGLTASSTGNKLLQKKMEKTKEKCDYSIAIAGNPNVRKIYNFQCTNTEWSNIQEIGHGKTVENSNRYLWI